MAAGRPRRADPGTLYTFAHQFYWDFRRLAEGSHRSRIDQKEYESLAKEADKAELSDDQKAELKQRVKRQVRAGKVKKTDSDARMRELEEHLLFATRQWRRAEAADMSTKRLVVPGEPEVLDELLSAETPEQVRTICMDAFVPRTVQVAPGVTREITAPNWPIAMGSVLPMYLSQYAAEFIAAKKDRRFPGSDRDSSLRKRFWFLSRALAGALYGVKTRTAINLLGSKRPEMTFEESRAARPARRKPKKKGRRKKKNTL